MHQKRHFATVDRIRDLTDSVEVSARTEEVATATNDDGLSLGGKE